MTQHYTNDMAGAENMDFVNYHYTDANTADSSKTNEKVHRTEKERVETPSGYEDFMQDTVSIPGYGLKKKKGFDFILNFVNKLNPNTIKLRNGLLAYLKFNTKGVSGDLRWSYISPGEAKQRGFNMETWQQFVKIRQRMDGFFYKAGGYPESLKTAILSGKGNMDRSIPDAENNPGQSQNLNTGLPLKEVLGSELYVSENEKELSVAESLDTKTAMTSANETIAVFSKMIGIAGDIINGKSSENPGFIANSDDEGFEYFFKHVFDIPSQKRSKEEDMPGTDGLGKAKEEDPMKDSNPPEVKTGVRSKIKGFYTKHKKQIVNCVIGLIGLAILGSWMYGHYIKKYGQNEDAPYTYEDTASPNGVA